MSQTSDSSGILLKSNKTIYSKKNYAVSIERVDGEGEFLSEFGDFTSIREALQHEFTSLVKNDEGGFEADFRDFLI